MKERPILFSGPMVQAILEGRKTQTRRLMKPQPTTDPLPREEWSDRRPCPPDIFPFRRLDQGRAHYGYGCPFGVPGDRLWVRETWCFADLEYDPAFPNDGRPTDEGGRWCYYAATEPDVEAEDNRGPWRPSIHMPRWASRITLEVTGVRVERLQAISEDDAKAEGLRGVTKDGRTVKYGIADRDGWPGTDNDGWPWHEWDVDPRRAYARLWDSINGERAPWASNPWVWVVEFRRQGEGR